MLRMKVIAVLLLLATVLAGCSDGDGDTPAVTSADCLERGQVLDPDAGVCIDAPFVPESFEDPNHFCVVQERRDRVHAPDLVGNPWELGQFWDYRLSVDDEDLGVTKMVYYDDQDNGLHYMVGTPTREEALHHALFGENPMIGRVHQVLYSPHESGDHADMFHFPLCDGSTWQTVFYGETFTLTASNATLNIPGGQDEGFIIQGTSNEGGALRLSYSPAAQWFTFIDLDRANGGTVDMVLEDTGTGYSGDAFFLRGQQDAFVFLSGDSPVANISGGTVSQTVGRDDGGDGPYDSVALHVVAGASGSGQGELRITDGDGTEVYLATLGTQTGVTVVDDVLEVPYSAGDWTVDLTGALVDAGETTLFAHVTMVSVYDRSGSV